MADTPVNGDRPVADASMDIDMDIDLGPEPEPEPEVELIQAVGVTQPHCARYAQIVLMVFRGGD